MSVESAQPVSTQPPATVVSPLSVVSAQGAQGLPVVLLGKPGAGAQSASYPPQSAAYPAMPAQLGSKSASLVPTSPAQATQSATAAQIGPASAVKQAVPEPDTALVKDNADDVVIAGRKGCSEGTIAIPADQTPVAWPAVSGAPLGYPGQLLLRVPHHCTCIATKTSYASNS